MCWGRKIWFWRGIRGFSFPCEKGVLSDKLHATRRYWGCNWDICHRFLAFSETFRSQKHSVEQNFATEKLLWNYPQMMKVIIRDRHVVSYVHFTTSELKEMTFYSVLLLWLLSVKKFHVHSMFWWCFGMFASTMDSMAEVLNTNQNGSQIGWYQHGM